MSKHTPGPWYIWNEHMELNRDTAIGPPLICAFNIEDGSSDIAEVFNDLDEFAANARLIASAPKMYELLKDYSEFHPDSGAFWDDVERLLREIDNE